MNDLPVLDCHEALTFHPLGSIGDINSAEKGSGARFNGGKPDLSLIPLRLIAAHYLSYQDVVNDRPILALDRLGRFQSTGDSVYLHECIDLFADDSPWKDCAHVFDYGRAKYKAWNWAKGMAWSVPLACAARHLMAMIEGEELDPESGLPHTGHVMCNLVMLLTYQRTFPEGNDLPKVGLI